MYLTKPLYWPLLFLIDMLGYIFIKPLILLKKLDVTKIKNILIIRNEDIGDIVLTTPLLRSLRQRFPKAKLMLLIREQAKELLIHSPNIDTIISTKSWFNEKFSLKEFFQLVEKLKHYHFDLAIDLHPDPRNILLGFLSSRHVIGYGSRGFGFFLSKRAGFKKQHIVDVILGIGKLVDANADNRELDLFLTKAEEKKAASLIGKIKGKIVCISPGARRQEKFWLTQGWAKLADWIHEKGKAAIIFTGSRNEKSLIKSIKAKMRHKPIDLTGKLSLLELAAVIKKCNLLICPDTGPLHIARAVKTPSIALFGPEDADVWGYNDKNAKSISSPTGKMKDIPLEKVIAAVGELL